MKKVSEDIFKIVSQIDLLEALKSHSVNSPNIVHHELTMFEAYERFSYLCTLLGQQIELGNFDKIAFQKRVTILNILKSINTNRNNLPSIIEQIENLYDNIQSSGLILSMLSESNVENEIKEITKLKKNYADFIKKFDETKRTLDFINKKRKELENVEEKKNELYTSLKDNKEDSDIVYAKIEATQKETLSILKEIKDNQATIEITKLSASTFSENIDEYKKNIIEIENKAKEVVAKEEKINSLIKSAEEALKLKSAEGISAAFSSQYELASQEINSKKWLRWSVSLLVVALGLTIWIIGGWGIKDPNSISSIVGRIVAVGISVAGAVFCSKQYVKQKNIAEDYAYKATLSKSIVAFAEEIAVSDEEGKQVGNYLNKVLTEIHKDPLRERTMKNDSNLLDEKSLNLIQKLIDTIKK